MLLIQIESNGINKSWSILSPLDVNPFYEKKKGVYMIEETVELYY